jgi:hypothetical protein
MKQLLYGREYDGAGWYALEGFCDEVMETTDALDALVRRRLVISGFHDREPRQVSSPCSAPLSAPVDVGVLVVRPALVASASQLTFQETSWLQSHCNTGGPPRVMLLITMCQPEVGSARTDFVLLQASSSSIPEAVPLTVLNLGDTVAAFDALVSAVRLHPPSQVGVPTSASATSQSDPHVTKEQQRGDEAMRAMLDEAQRLRNEILQLQAALAQ